MTTKFLSRNDEAYRVLHQDKDTCWLISFEDSARRPFCIAREELNDFQRIPAPQNYAPEDGDLSPAAARRLALIQPLLDQGLTVITDRQLRIAVAKDIAERQTTSMRRVLRLYYRYLATGQVTFSKNREIHVNDTFDWAIKTLYFSAKRFSLRATYDMMLVQKYTNSAGKLLENM